MLSATIESRYQSRPMEPKAKVAVIGAGASGIVAIKECLAIGLSVTCFEQSDAIGGLWRYEEPKAGQEVHSSVYRNTIINTSKPMVIYIIKDRWHFLIFQFHILGQLSFTIRQS